MAEGIHQEPAAARNELVEEVTRTILTVNVTLTAVTGSLTSVGLDGCAKARNMAELDQMVSAMNSVAAIRCWPAPPPNRPGPTSWDGRASLLRAKLEAEQGVLHDLAERRVDPVLTERHLGHRLTERHRLDQRLDEVGGLVADQVCAEQFPRGWVRDQLADTGGVLHCPAVSRVTVRL